MSTPAGAGIASLPLEQIEIDPENVRTHYDEAVLEGFRELLRTGGEFINPPHVYRVGANRYRVKHGNTRVLAAQGIVTELPVRIVPAPSSSEERVASQLSENLAQGGLSPLDTARALQQLRKSGLSIRGIQEHLASYGVKRSVAWVHTTLKMLELPIDVQEQIERGEVKPWEAVAPTTSKVVRVPLEAAQADFRQHIEDLAVQLLNEPPSRRTPTRSGSGERSGTASRRWEVLPMHNDPADLVRLVNEEGRQDVILALNMLKAVLENGLLPSDSAGARLLKLRLRRLR